VCVSQSASLCILKSEENRRRRNFTLFDFRIFSRFIFLVETKLKQDSGLKKLSFKETFFAEKEIFHFGNSFFLSKGNLNLH